MIGECCRDTIQSQLALSDCENLSLLGHAINKRVNEKLQQLGLKPHWGWGVEGREEGNENLVNDNLIFLGEASLQWWILI